MVSCTSKFVEYRSLSVLTTKTNKKPKQRDTGNFRKCWVCFVTLMVVMASQVLAYVQIHNVLRSVCCVLSRV